jgi:uncharacterized lipoprotein YajG
VNYSVSFFNGDVKLFEGATEKLCIKNLHSSQITSQLFYFSPSVQSDVFITCSELPEAALTVSSVKNIKTKPEASVIARASLGELENVASGGFSSLA